MELCWRLLTPTDLESYSTIVPLVEVLCIPPLARACGRHQIVQMEEVKQVNRELLFSKSLYGPKAFNVPPAHPVYTLHHRAYHHFACSSRLKQPSNPSASSCRVINRNLHSQHLSTAFQILRAPSTRGQKVPFGEFWYFSSSQPRLVVVSEHETSQGA